MNMRPAAQNFSDCSTKVVGRTSIRLDEMDAQRVAQHLVAYTPTHAEISSLFERAQQEIGTFADINTVHRIVSRNPDTISAFNLRARHDISAPQAGGFIAWLPLTSTGKAALLSGTFDAADPASDHIAGQHDRPAAIYVWGMFAPGRLAAGIVWANQRWSMPFSRHADIYARAATPSGLRFMERIGFERLDAAGAHHLNDMFVYRRSPAWPAPIRWPKYEVSASLVA